jgi:hypothetical protein
VEQGRGDLGIEIGVEPDRQAAISARSVAVPLSIGALFTVSSKNSQITCESISVTPRSVSAITGTWPVGFRSRNSSRRNQGDSRTGS